MGGGYDNWLYTSLHKRTGGVVRELLSHNNYTTQHKTQLHTANSLKWVRNHGNHNHIRSSQDTSRILLLFPIPKALFERHGHVNMSLSYWGLSDPNRTGSRSFTNRAWSNHAMRSAILSSRHEGASFFRLLLFC
jgi:hypothetical protein